MRRLPNSLLKMLKLKMLKNNCFIVQHRFGIVIHTELRHLVLAKCLFITDAGWNASVVTVSI